MKRILHPADMKIGQYFRPIFIRVEFQEGRLSLTGVIGPMRNGDAYGSCGQIDMEFAHRTPADDDSRYSAPTRPDELTFAPGWTAESWLDLLDIWHKWHLNDMRAGCEHQRSIWDPEKELTLTRLEWGETFHKMRRAAEEGEIRPDAYSDYAHNAQIVNRVTIETHPSDPDLWDSEIRGLIDHGYLKIGKAETKRAGWVKPEEHPEGILCKPCPTCGYLYGSSWLREEVPAEVIAFLESLPPSDRVPAWV